MDGPNHGKSVEGSWTGSLLYFFLLLFLSLCPESEARTERRFIGEQIPERLVLESSLVFSGSDSLFLNGRLLSSGVDYLLDLPSKQIDLSQLETMSNDTLVVIYSTWPYWVRQSYGRELPSSEETDRSRAATRLPSGVVSPVEAGSDISIAGSKSFRFSARSSGTSEFGQSIDLNISGELSPGLRINGSISDRGYDPTYGTANSRLSELDKINLTLSSSSLLVQVGDINLPGGVGMRSNQVRSVSGAVVVIKERQWHAGAAVARPRGRFHSVQLTGTDGNQGPYQIDPRGGAIVPGSETVWLNGIKLRESANSDYLIEYATGQITFNVNHPIDRRSRIEIDFEPLSTAYKGELMSTGGGVTLGDTSFFASLDWLREGDDADQPLLGSLSNTDLDLLARAGDDPSLAVRSGVVADTAGDYVLQIQNPTDSIYSYVGPGLGDYRVSFTFVGTGLGDYRFAGLGRYDYVGAGLADYLPVVPIRLPERTDYLAVRVGARSDAFGTVILDLRQTDYDRNLLSAADDENNIGRLINLEASKSWSHSLGANTVRASVRRKEIEYNTNDRLYRADFGREFLLPVNMKIETDETLYDFGGTIGLGSMIEIAPSYSHLKYEDNLSSNAGGAQLRVVPTDRITLTGGWRGIDTRLLKTGNDGEGSGLALVARVAYKLTPGTKVTTEIESDRREHNYSGAMQGTRYRQYRLSVRGEKGSLTGEYYVEDSLVADWQEELERYRLVGTKQGHVGPVGIEVDASYQRLDRAGSIEENGLGRVNYRYRPKRSRLSLDGSYMLSEETRNGRGISYLEVPAGTGNYILEDNEYIPDPDGNFIRVEEILSDRRSVRRGEKSFRFSKRSKLLVLRFDSDIKEELLPGSARPVWWVVPFFSDASKDYLFYNRRYHSEAKLFPLRSGHVLNLSFDQELQIRQITGGRQQRRDSRGTVTIREEYGLMIFEQGVEIFDNDRDAYFSGGGDISGYQLSNRIRRVASAGEIALGASYRKATGADDDRSETVAGTLETRIKAAGRGEIRAQVELYRQTLSGEGTNLSYVLTDNRSGQRGARWSLRINYSPRKDWRMNLTLSGRHSDNRTGRVTARGEFVVGL